MGSPLQNGLPLALVPAGRLKVWIVDVPPLADTVSVAPPIVGVPTMVLVLAVSLALTMTLRLSGLDPAFTLSWLPRIVWSAAPATTGISEARRKIRTAVAIRVMGLSPFDVVSSLRSERPTAEDGRADRTRASSRMSRDAAA